MDVERIKHSVLEERLADFHVEERWLGFAVPHLGYAREVLIPSSRSAGRRWRLLACQVTLRQAIVFVRQPALQLRELCAVRPLRLRRGQLGGRLGVFHGSVALRRVAQLRSAGAEVTRQRLV